MFKKVKVKTEKEPTNILWVTPVAGQLWQGGPPRQVSYSLISFRLSQGVYKSGSLLWDNKDSVLCGHLLPSSVTRMCLSFFCISFDKTYRNWLLCQLKTRLLIPPHTFLRYIDLEICENAYGVLTPYLKRSCMLSTSHRCSSASPNYQPTAYAGGCSWEFLMYCHDFSHL